MYNPPNSPVRKNGKKFYYQGFFNPINIDKYLGNVQKIIYRSKWELCFMHYCDTSNIILRWSCEHIVITYSDEKGKIHRYYPDFYIERASSQDKNNLIRAIIEIKPDKEIKPDFVTNEGYIIPPELYLKSMTSKKMENYEYQLRTYQKNLQKWTKSKGWCEKNGMQFVLMGESYMKEKGIM